MQSIPHISYAAIKLPKLSAKYTRCLEEQAMLLTLCKAPAAAKASETMAKETNMDKDDASEQHTTATGLLEEWKGDTFKWLPAAFQL